MNSKFIHSARKGIASMLAMLFLVLFGTLAIGFYASTNISTQVATNDDQAAKAFTATESGMELMRYQLANVSIPPDQTTAAQVTPILFANLQAQLNGTGNMGSMTISMPYANTIWIPGNSTSTIKLDSAGQSSFRSSVIVGENGVITVTATGAYGTTSGSSRAIQLWYTRQPHTTSVFDYAVASKGQIVMSKGAVTSTNGVDPDIATVMSDQATGTAITVSGGTIGGDLNVTSSGSVSVSGGTVGGSSVPATILSDHTHVVGDPDFPTIDTTIYKQYAVNNWVNKAKVQQNIIIPPGTNPKFNANDEVDGIMYIQSPNQVTFNGAFNLKGFIVMEPGASPTDSLTFSGNLTMSALPAGTSFDPLRTMTGVAVLAPNAAMSMTGSSGGNVTGNIIVNSFTFNGSADLQIDKGTLMTLSPNNNSAVFKGKSVKFSSTGSHNQPTAGLSYDAYYVPEADSYVELKAQ